jgi:hypothetical protein
VDVGCDQAAFAEGPWISKEARCARRAARQARDWFNAAQVIQTKREISSRTGARVESSLLEHVNGITT